MKNRKKKEGQARKLAAAGAEGAGGQTGVDEVEPPSTEPPSEGGAGGQTGVDEVDVAGTKRKAEGDPQRPRS